MPHHAARVTDAEGLGEPEAAWLDARDGERLDRVLVGWTIALGLTRVDSGISVYLNC